MEANLKTEYIEKLILAKTKVKITLKDERFYTGIIISVCPLSMLFLDKYNCELFFALDDIKRIIPTRNGEGE